MGYRWRPPSFEQATGWWRDRAACHDKPVEWFFPEGRGRHSVPEARQLCAGCPVAADCLEFALAVPSMVGFWGGTTAEERKRIRAERRQETRRETAA